MKKAISCSVVVCTRNRPVDLAKCLMSLVRQTQVPGEIIIVDSSDGGACTITAEQFFSAVQAYEIVVKQVHTKPGLTYQRNVGIELATSEILFFFDDDVVLESDYIACMLEVFERDVRYGGGMGAITNIPAKVGGWQRMLRTFFLLQRDYASGRFTWSGMPTHTYGCQKFREVEVLGGCGMAFRRTLIARHRFDEKLVRYAYMEDCDASRRVSREAPLFFNPAAKLQHFNSPLARDRVIDNRAMFIKNYSYLFFKNFYSHRKYCLLAYGWSIVGLFVEALLICNYAYMQGYCKGLKEFYMKE